MKVRQLLKHLESCDPNDEVSFGYVEYDGNGDTKTVTFVDIEFVGEQPDEQGPLISNGFEEDLAALIEEDDDDKEIEVVGDLPIEDEL